MKPGKRQLNSEAEAMWQIVQLLLHANGTNEAFQKALDMADAIESRLKEF